MKSEEISKEFISKTEETDIIIDNIWSEYKFTGKTLDEWDKEFYICIPKDPKPETIRVIFRDLGDSIQRVSIYYNICSSVLNFLLYVKTKSIDKQIQEIVNDYQKRNAKRPAKDIIQSLAISNIDELEFQVTMFQILKTYWREKRDTLSEVRKNLEQIHISMSTELKYLDR